MCKERLAERPFRKVNDEEVAGRSENTKLKANEVGATGWRLLVRNIKSRAVTRHSSMTTIKLQLNKWFQSQSLISNAGWANSFGPARCLVFIFCFCFFLPLRPGRSVEEGEVKRKRRREESRAGPGSGQGGGGGWSVEGHFVPCLIFVFT